MYYKFKCMRSKIINFFLLILVLSIYIKPAYAYIDPGTISIIISGLIGVFVTIGVYLRKYYDKIKHFCRKLLKIKSK